jgi:NAD(P)-dependent dehydrogenase (short-subunit alcohol dehydrogenase family)
VVNIVGVGGRTGDAEFTLGGSVNAALLYLTKALADRGIGDGVRVNAINPGLIATDRLRKRIQTLAAEQRMTEADAVRQMLHGQGIARFGGPDEIARVVAFLASPWQATARGPSWTWTAARPGRCRRACGIDGPVSAALLPAHRGSCSIHALIRAVPSVSTTLEAMCGIRPRPSFCMR